MTQSPYQNTGTYSMGGTQAQVQAKDTFIVRTYAHLFLAIITFTLLEIVLFKTGVAKGIAGFLLQGNWLLVLGGFIVVGWIASHVAHSAESLPMQYLALMGYIVAEAIIFVPLLFIANTYAPGAIQSAAVVTLFGFSLLTFIAFQTRKDFSFLGGILRWGMGLALVAIVAGVIFGINLGTGFSVIMVGLAGAAILYDTSKIMYSFPQDRYVAAALQLFASVALMFWYVLSIFIARD